MKSGRYLLSSLLIICFCCINQYAYATHNRAGEITYRVINGLTIEATLVTYTSTISTIDRDSLEICWGDGQCENIPRVNGLNGEGELLPNNTKLNKYVQIHTYGGPARYNISMTDPNRNAGILNVNWPNSVNIPFHIESTISFFNTNFTGENNSPILSQPPIDIACTGQPFIHNPNAYDPDGDSLAYRLIVPLQAVGVAASNYQFPSQIMPNPASNQHTLNEITGTFTWASPQQEGEYNIAMYIIQYREGIAIDTMIRDMQILVKACDNMPPEIETEMEYCVIAGETLSFDVVATAPTEESEQKVSMAAFGAPLELGFSPAIFNIDTGYQDQPLVGTFVWETKCEHIADQYYTVIFRAADDFPIADSNGEVVYLSSLKRVRIRVVGPPPEDVNAIADNDQIDISWELPYFCEEVMNDYFQGFRVWRREGSNPFVIDTCDPGLEGRGYELLTLSPIKTELDNRYYYPDNTAESGKSYCYRIEARFARLSAANQPFNWVSSLPSTEVCVQLTRDIPLITNVSVIETDIANGQIEVRWSKPDPNDLDTLLNPGPYIYELYHAIGLNPSDDEFELIPDAVFTAATFAQANDTFYTDTGLNTQDEAHSYKIAFYASNDSEPIGITPLASSVFLTITPTDNTNNLSWDFNVPWENQRYIILRADAGGNFDSIGQSTEAFFSDSGLLNGQEYCYKIRAFGTYGISDIVDPLINDSQEACGTPIDDIAPCPPILEVTNVCDFLGGAESISCENEDNLFNNLSWLNPIDICDETDDVVGYNIYYAPFEDADLMLIQSIDNSEILEFEHFPEIGIAGCYVVTAVDSFANESTFSNIICKDNCPFYELPNVFTPNGDDQNDLFTPFPYCFVDRIELQIFNRWGNLVFETSDPDINWNGKNLKNTDLTEGVYFYTCKVFEQRVNGIARRPDILKGSVQIIR